MTPNHVQSKEDLRDSTRRLYYLSEDNCEVPSFRLTDWDEIARLRKEASRLASGLLERLRDGGTVSWDELREISRGNTTLWKLLLKELRLLGVNIGNNKDQKVRFLAVG